MLNNAGQSIVSVKKASEQVMRRYLRATDMTSPVWPTKAVVCWPVSMSQSPQVMSPLKWRIRRLIKEGDFDT